MNLISQSEANGAVLMTTQQIGDLFDIDRRIKEGDESGWRGDPSMGVFFNRITHCYEVWGIDRAGNDYLAASHDKLDHTLLIKLREGDPRKHDVFQRVMDHNEKLKADQAAADHEKLGAMAEKMAWAIRRDFAAHMGGGKRQHSIPAVPYKQEVAG
jgi:hypothetical protein